MFKEMKLSKKISFGFSSILIIAVILGLIAIFNMTRSGSDAKKLDTEFAPSVSLASELTTSVNSIMLNVRSYGLSEMPVYYENYKKEDENFGKIISKFEELEKETKNMPELNTYITEVKKSYGEYKIYIEQTKQMNDSLAKLRADLLGLANIYMENANSFLGANLSSTKLSSNINQVIALGNSVRINYFRAQVQRDISLLETALNDINKITNLLDETRSLTKNEVDIRTIDTIKTSLNNYKNSLTEFLTTWKNRTEMENIRIC